MRNAECRNCAAKLQLYADSELSASESAMVQSHLGACDDCRAILTSMEKMSSAVRKHAPYYGAPPGLAARVMGDPLKGWRVPKAMPWMRWTLPGFSAAALALALSLFLSSPSTDDMLADEAVSIHVRSLMAQHITDVTSTDQHTVKPWFAGRVDFSPPVHDFAKDGYPLVGGRLEYVQHQPAAALVYRRNKHVINVLVTPSSRSDMPMKALSRRGYNLVVWRRNNLYFEAVSDLNAAELGDLCKLIAESS
jgi:anti-sigma factor RsiW